MKILRSATKHGCSIADIEHAMDNRLATVNSVDDREPPAALVIGPDTNGNILELLINEEDGVVFHAMALRKVFLRHLPKAE